MLDLYGYLEAGVISHHGRAETISWRTLAALAYRGLCTYHFEDGRVWATKNPPESSKV